MLALIPAAFVALFALTLPSARAVAVLQALVWTLFQLLLYADTRIWNLFRTTSRDGLERDHDSGIGGCDRSRTEDLAFAALIGLVLFTALWLLGGRTCSSPAGSRAWASGGVLRAPRDRDLRERAVRLAEPSRATAA